VGIPGNQKEIGNVAQRKGLGQTGSVLAGKGGREEVRAESLVLGPILHLRQRKRGCKRGLFIAITWRFKGGYLRKQGRGGQTIVNPSKKLTVVDRQKWGGFYHQKNHLLYPGGARV